MLCKTQGLDSLTERQKQNFWSKVDKVSSPHGCWIWVAGKFKSGYGEFQVNRKPILTHRLSYIMKNGIPPNDNPFILHNCPGGDNRACVNPEHLWAGTHLKNARDKELKGRGNHAFGEKNGRYTMPERTARGDRSGTRTHPEKIRKGSQKWNAKLKENLIPGIRLEYSLGGKSFETLGKKYGVSRTLIGHIISGKIWRHV